MSCNANSIVVLTFIISFFFFSLTVQAQQRLSGALISENDRLPVSNAIITLNTEAGKIVGFANSDASGKFDIRIADSLLKNRMFMDISCIGFRRTKAEYHRGISHYEITLTRDVIMLQEVKVKNRPIINAKGDTLSYNVNSFSQQQDRTIGDVLSRMPGIEIQENGQISYNGKPIYNLYVGGDDLLDGRYNLGTRTISKDVIQSVEVLQNFQPIKALKDKERTDNVALNLVIKDNAALTLNGQLMIAGGIPHQYDASANTILFNKKVKMLNAFMFNNSGVNYRNDIRQLGMSNGLLNNPADRPTPPLSLGTVGDPDLPARNYYLNRSGLIDLNDLYTFKNGMQLKANVQGMVDRNTLNYTGYTNYYYQNDTVRYDESQAIVRRPQILNATVKATMNKDRYYLNNDLKFNYTKADDVANMIFNQAGFGQQIKSSIRELANDLRYTPVLKGQNIIDATWNISYIDQPQLLSIDSGIHSTVLNDSRPFAAVNQTVTIPAFISNAGVSYSMVKRPFRIMFKFAVNNERIKFRSMTETIQLDDSIGVTPISSRNAVSWNKDKASASIGFDLRKNKWEILVNMPLNYQRIKYSDLFNALDQHRTDKYLNPSGRIKFLTLGGDFIQYNFNFSRMFGDITAIYPGSVITNFRTIQQNAGVLQVKNSFSSALSYNFQRPLSLLFMNAAINYTTINSNTLPVVRINEEIQRIELMPLENRMSNWSANLGIGKYLFFLNATSSLKMNWSNTKFNQIVNNELLTFSNHIFSIHGILETKLFKRVNLQYDFSNRYVNIGQKNTGENASGRYTRTDQAINGTWQINKRLFFISKCRLIQSNNDQTDGRSYYFIDANIKYRLVKWKADLELNSSDLINNRQFENFAINSNFLSYYEYTLRGRMIVGRVIFNF